ncbi:Hypothetical protein RMA_p07 (plasmid) [Rickettsia massiliae MTU5]|uniref:Uncharacterized protein n=1 Tax=Rickettsia massiliae (strain Mtu5) TaxID=416276 RepID=A8F338_RICM5|nr:Hypothetical protein RMA_p07 [Rickettsia massiliae MTU5]
MLVNPYNLMVIVCSNSFSRRGSLTSAFTLAKVDATGFSSTKPGILFCIPCFIYLSEYEYFLALTIACSSSNSCFHHDAPYNTSHMLYLKF